MAIEFNGPGTIKLEEMRRDRYAVSSALAFDPIDDNSTSHFEFGR